MVLKIKDVADLLNLSETTIRRWLADGKIPAYRIHHQYRFNRQEIEDWVMCQKIGKFSHGTPLVSTEPEEEGSKALSRGSKQFSLYRALHKGQVIHDILEEKKESVIRSSMKKIAQNLGLDADVISDLLMDRENLQS